ncbi:MAG TPA: hypothetical protein VNB03_16550, partial [Casimicrobiaceae bacterium]|nr:hypothetical protein [Casimicrobiaceae bacterium]
MRRAAVLAFVGALGAGCAAIPGTSPADITLYDDDVAPLIIAMTTPMESPPLDPIEPVEPPLQAPPLMPPLPAPVTMSQAPQVPTSNPVPPQPQANGAPGANVVAAASPTALPPTAVLPTEELAALALIADLQRYNALGADDIRRELSVATNALARERSDANRVRLAVLYTLARSAPQDDQRALQLLDNVARSGGSATPVKALAAVLHVQVSDRIRSVRDEQAKANEAVQKLEALRAMERSLLRDRVR